MTKQVLVFTQIDPDYSEMGEISISVPLDHPIATAASLAAIDRLDWDCRETSWRWPGFSDGDRSIIDHGLYLSPGEANWHQIERWAEGLGIEPETIP